LEAARWVGMGVTHAVEGVRGWRGVRRRGLLRAEGAEAEEAFVAGEVDLDFDRLSVVGEGHRKIGRALQLEADRGVASGLLQYDSAEVHVGDRLRRVESVVGRVARDICLPGWPGDKKRRTCASSVVRWGEGVLTNFCRGRDKSWEVRQGDERVGWSTKRRRLEAVRHQPILSIPLTKSKCPSFERIRALCCLAWAAIQTSCHGMGRPSFLSWRLIFT
jgi:hypothetical protein